MKIKNKKGISVMIGYVLLISFAVVIGAVVFAWMKTYVPRDAASCPSETSLFLKTYDYNCSTNILEINLVNNGNFNIAGYFIHATNSSETTLAAKDLSSYYSGTTQGNMVRFLPLSEDNGFKSGDAERSGVFDLTPSGFGTLYSIEIVPARFQVEKNKKLLVSCTNARIKEILSCS